ncbi:MAG: hypothetical protein LW875_07215 [Proteobacteria bacterium]|jgi:hypothetical protein|nr:hypothetical protein [Pseudomonadota bacterium]
MLQPPASILKSFQALFLGITLLASNAVSANYSSELFEQGSGFSKKLYTFQLTNTAEGDLLKSVAQYKALDGSVVVEERATLKAANSELVRLEVDQNQIGAKAVIQVEGDKILFTKTQDGKEKKSDEKKGSTLVVASNFHAFVKSQWSQIMAGKTIDFRYGVWSRLETVGFEVSKVGTEKIGADEAVVIRMKPSSFIIAALVKPLTFKWAADGSRILQMNGRVPPMQKVGSEFKDLDAEVMYKY